MPACAWHLHQAANDWQTPGTDMGLRTVWISSKLCAPRRRPSYSCFPRYFGCPCVCAKACSSAKLLPSSTCCPAAHPCNVVRDEVFLVQQVTCCSPPEVLTTAGTAAARAGRL